MGCVCCCPLTEEEERERRPILDAHSPTEPISIPPHPSPLGKDAKWTELSGTPVDPRRTLTMENEEILLRFCERVIPHDPLYIDTDVVEDRIKLSEHYTAEYLGDVRINQYRRPSIKPEYVSPPDEEAFSEVNRLTIELVRELRSSKTNVHFH